MKNSGSSNADEEIRNKHGVFLVLLSAAIIGSMQDGSLLLFSIFGAMLVFLLLTSSELFPKIKKVDITRNNAKGVWVLLWATLILIFSTSGKEDSTQLHSEIKAESTTPEILHSEEELPILTNVYSESLYFLKEGMSMAQLQKDGYKDICYNASKRVNPEVKRVKMIVESNKDYYNPLGAALINLDICTLCLKSSEEHCEMAKDNLEFAKEVHKL